MVKTAVRRGGQFYYSFVANLLKYLYAKNYENIVRFDKVIAKTIRVQFFCLTVYNLLNSSNKRAWWSSVVIELAATKPSFCGKSTARR